MEKIKVAIVFGGHSSEYSVSLHSVASVLNNIDMNKYEVVTIGITEAGKMMYYEGSVEAIENDTWWQTAQKATLSLEPEDQGFYVVNDDHIALKKVDVVFPVMHGKFGEDGTLQGALAMAQVPFVGCDTLSSAVAMDKEFTHIICESVGIEMAPYICVKNTVNLDYPAIYEKAYAKLHVPMFIKPANAGSSYGISKVEDYESFEAGLKLAFEHDSKVLIEQAITGFEVGCAVLGNEKLTIGEIDEIETTRSFFDFEGKYEMSGSKIHCPARISDELKEEVKKRAEVIYRTLGCSGFSRIDFFIDHEQNIVFNELNTIPGFTANSRYPSMMKAVGISFSALIDQLLSLALER